MKKVIIIITLIFCLIPLEITAQENFLPGSIVTLTGETIEGLIDFRNWSRNPSAISYKKDGDAEKIVYSPLQISGFTVAGENYKSAVVQTEKSPFVLDQLNFDAELKLVTDTVFLYTLASGSKVLLHFIDDLDKENFYIDSGSDITLLLHKTYLKEIKKKDISGDWFSDADSKIENKSYLGQLAVYMNDCPDIPAHLNSIEYSQKDLLSLFKIYQKECDPSAIINKERKISVDLGVISGLSLNKLNWGKNETLGFSQTQYDYSPNMVIGFLLDAKFRGHMNKWSLVNELLYTPYKVEGVYNNYINEDRYSILTTEIGSRYIRMNNMIRFTYPAGKFSIFVNAGITNAIGSVSHNYLKWDTKVYTNEEKGTGLAMEKTDKYELGFNLGLGAGYKKWSFDMRWEQGDGMSALVALPSKTSKLYALFAYRFN